MSTKRIESDIHENGVHGNGVKKLKETTETDSSVNPESTPVEKVEKKREKSF